MQPGKGETHFEPARQVPVYGSCDVLVLGGGPGGTAAAIGAAAAGADTVLVERYGHLGGLASGGHVCFIDRMTDWDGRLVVAGVGEEFMDRCGVEAGGIIGPEREYWGSRDAELVEYWGPRANAHRGVVAWSPTIDPEMLKLASNDLVRERGVHTLFHCWAVAPVMRDDTPVPTVGGAVFESKEGRFAIRAAVTIDCTGDGDLFEAAGAAFETNRDDTTIHSCVNTSGRFGGVDTEVFWHFRTYDIEGYKAKLQEARAAGSVIRASILPRDGQVLTMHPKYHGYSAIRVADLSEVEFRSRDDLRRGLAWWRRHMPGWQHAYLMESADQIGVRHSRRLVGEVQITLDQWKRSGRHADSIGLCPGVSQAYPTLEIPLRQPGAARGGGPAGRRPQPELRRALAQPAARGAGVLGDGPGRRRRRRAGGRPRRCRTRRAGGGDAGRATPPRRRRHAAGPGRTGRTGRGRCGTRRSRGARVQSVRRGPGAALQQTGDREESGRSLRDMEDNENRCTSIARRPGLSDQVTA